MVKLRMGASRTTSDALVTQTPRVRRRSVFITSAFAVVFVTLLVGNVVLGTTVGFDSDTVVGTTLYVMVLSDVFYDHERYGRGRFVVDVRGVRGQVTNDRLMRRVRVLNVLVLVSSALALVTATVATLRYGLDVINAVSLVLAGCLVTVSSLDLRRHPAGGR